MKLTKSMKKALSFLLTAAMVVTSATLPSVTKSASAADEVSTSVSVVFAGTTVDSWDNFTSEAKNVTANGDYSTSVDVSTSALRNVGFVATVVSSSAIVTVNSIDFAVGDKTYNIPYTAALEVGSTTKNGMANIWNAAGKTNGVITAGTEASLVGDGGTNIFIALNDAIDTKLAFTKITYNYTVSGLAGTDETTAPETAAPASSAAATAEATATAEVTEAPIVTSAPTSYAISDTKNGVCYVDGKSSGGVRFNLSNPYNNEISYTTNTDEDGKVITDPKSELLTDIASEADGSAYNFVEKVDNDGNKTPIDFLPDAVAYNAGDTVSFNFVVKAGLRDSKTVAVPNYVVNSILPYEKAITTDSKSFSLNMGGNLDSAWGTSVTTEVKGEGSYSLTFTAVDTVADVTVAYINIPEYTNAADFFNDWQVIFTGITVNKAADYTIPSWYTAPVAASSNPANTAAAATSPAVTKAATASATTKAAATTNAVSATSLTLAKSTVIVAPGKSVSVKYSVKPSNTTDQITATSSSSKVTATVVSGSSIVKIAASSKAVRGTSANVTLKAGSKSATIKVKIQNKAKKVKAAKKTVTIKKGKTAKVVVKVTAQNKKKATTDTVKGSVKKAKIAKVKSKTVAAGKVTLKVKAADRKSVV